MQLVDDNIIRVLGFQTQRLQRACWKVFQIEGDDGIRVAYQCCGEHMAIIGVWQIYDAGKALVASNQ